MEEFSESFRVDLPDLMPWRRDLRRCRNDPVVEALLMQCLNPFQMAAILGCLKLGGLSTFARMWRAGGFLVANLCLGHLADVSLTPELEIKGWEAPAPTLELKERRCFA